MGRYEQHIASVLGGNKRAFAHLVARFGDMALAIALARLGDEALAEDAVQEAFLTAYLKLSQLREHAAFPGWFRTILIRRCEAVGRQRDRAIPPGSDDMEDIACDEAVAPHQIYTRLLDQAMVRRVLTKLPGAAREACILRFVHGQAYRDIAETLGVPVGTIKRRIHDARDRVVTEFQKLRPRIMRVGYLPISDHLLAMVAHCRGGGGEREINLARFLSWSSLARALTDGTLDAAFIMAPLAMQLRNKGVPLLYVLDGHHDGSAITVRRDVSDRDLLRARVGLPHAASTQRMYLQGLTGYGQRPGPGEERALYVGPSYLDRRMAERRIDFFFCAEPWNTKSQAEGSGRVLARSKDFAPGHVCCGLAVLEHYARDNGDFLCEYVQSLLDAARFATSHPGECAKIQERYTGISHDIAHSILERGHVTFRDLVPDKGRLEQSMRMALSTSILDTPCDLNTFLHPEYA